MSRKILRQALNIFIPLFLVLFLHGGSLAAEPQKVIRLKTTFEIMFNPDGTNIHFGVGHSPMSGRKGWTIKQAGPDVYHLKYWTWEKDFLEVDIHKKRIHMVKEGFFGTPDDRPDAIHTEISLIIPDKTMSNIDFSASNCVITYDLESKKIDVHINGMSILSPEEWETAEVAPNVYQIKHSSWIGAFWEIDAQQKKASRIFSEEFGKFGVPGTELYRTFFEGAAATAHNGTGPLPDAGFNSSASPRISEWTRNEKALFTPVLFQGAYDVLVAPFQVQGNAVDRANRSLMTRYLSNEIEKLTGLALPDPTIVDRALGYGLRRLSDDEIYRIAGAVKARTVIRGYVGHDLEENMFLTLLVQIRGADGKLDQSTAATRLEWKNVSFSDGQPPAEAFRGIVRDIMAKLPLQPVKTPKLVRFEKGNLPVPESLSSLAKGGGSALQNTYYLQLLGILYPEDSTWNHVDDFFEREPLFERSLVALEGISPDSADYRLLKARAWFYLRSRPAAIKALGTPKTPEEKAFMAFLNGNLPEMEKWADKITSPIDKLITRIQLNDLRFDYTPDFSGRDSARELALAHKGLEVLIARRLSGKDIWDWMPNALIKKLMDENFPVAGFDIETILRGKFASGEKSQDDEEIDLSIYKHRQKALEKEPARFAANGGHRPVPFDSLDLLYHLGESTIWKKARLMISAQGLYEEAKGLLEKYESVYTGNIKYMTMKRIAYWHLAETQRNHLFSREESGLQEKICYHAQGQLAIAATCDHKDYYRHDWPRHWAGSDYAKDRNLRKEFSVKGLDPSSIARMAHEITRLEHDLLYTNNPYMLFKYYDDLAELGLHKEADELISLNESRFSGNSQKTSFLAKIASRKGDLDMMAALYEQAMAESPSVWENYKGRGLLHLDKGEYEKARAVFEKYPEFKENNGGGVYFSNIAYETGYRFLSKGRIADAEVFLKKSAANDTGAQAEYISRAHLALIAGKFKEAAAHELQVYKRYENFDDADEYMAILHALGKHEDATAIRNSTDPHDDLPFSAFIGFRMNGIDEDEQIRLLTEEGQYRISMLTAINYAVLGMMDRAPEKSAITRAERLPSFGGAEYESIRYFGSAYNNLRKSDVLSAYNDLRRFQDDHLRPQIIHTYKNYGMVVPYFAYAAVKTGHAGEAIEFLSEIKKKLGEDYQYHLSMAFINGLEGRHADAIMSLKAARSRIGSLVSLPLSQWYKLTEACEWLYNESGREEYRKMAISLAKTYQKIMPYWAWAYAVEAKYASPGPERTRALALTLYLDKKSERISGIPESEKAAALKWFEKNNPFLSKKRQAGGL